MNKVEQAIAVVNQLKDLELMMFYQTICEESIADMRNDYRCNTDMRQAFIGQLLHGDLAWLAEGEPSYDLQQDLIDWPSRSVQHKEEQVAQWLAVQAKQDSGDFDDWKETP